MERRIKIVGIIALVGVAVGGFALTKYLTRNVKKYKYNTIILSKEDYASQSSENIE